MNKYYLVIFFVLSSVKCFAQNYKLGKVSIEELKESVCPIDSTANASILYKYEYISFEYRQDEGFIQNRKVHERIKIYNKEGFDWATKKIRLYNKSNANSENVTTLKGYTFNLIEGKIQEDKLKKDGIFEEEANKYWKFQTFTMPNIKEGCVIDYEYEIRSPYLSIDDIDFQYTIPVIKFELKVKTPEYFIYNKLLNPRAAYIPKLKDSKENASFTINSKTKSSNLNGAQSSYSQSKIDYIENIIESDETNIPALKNEPLVDNLDNYRAKLILEHSGTKYPNEPYKSYTTTWDDVTKSIYDNPDFGNQLERNGFYEDDVNALINGETNLVAKALLIYNFVKQKVKWNGYYGFTTENGVRKAYLEGIGNTADINLMLVSMLRYAGIKANPVLVSTKNNGIPLFPTRQGFNYVICIIEDEGLTSLIDATETYGTFNILPNRVLNWQGRIIREYGSSAWINLNTIMSSNQSVMLNIQINDDLSINGKVRSSFTNYMAYNYRDRFTGISEEDHIKYLEKDKGEIIIESIEFENDKNPLEPVKLTYDYELNGAIEEIGDKLYFSPLLFLSSTENPFKQKTRNFPITIDNPVETKYMVNISLPDGYAIEYLPESKGLDFNNGKAKFNYVIKENGKYLQLIVNFDINTSLILPKDYEYFKTFYGLSIEKQNEKVVLKKI